MSVHHDQWYKRYTSFGYFTLYTEVYSVLIQKFYTCGCGRSSYLVWILREWWKDISFLDFGDGSRNDSRSKILGQKIF